MSTTVKELADRLKTIMENPELIAKLAEQDAKDGSISANLDKLEENVTKLEELYKQN